MAQFPFVAQSSRAPSAVASLADRDMAHAAAVRLADSINRYWSELGYDAEARVVEIRILDGRGNADEFGVVSNLRNGVPSRRRPDVNENAFAAKSDRS